MATLNPNLIAEIDKAVAQLPNAAQTVVNLWKAPILQLVANTIQGAGDGALLAVDNFLKGLTPTKLDAIHVLMTDEELAAEAVALAALAKEAAQNSYDAQQVIQNFFNGIGRALLVAALTPVVV